MHMVLLLSIQIRDYAHNAQVALRHCLSVHVFGIYDIRLGQPQILGNCHLSVTRVPQCILGNFYVLGNRIMRRGFFGHFTFYTVMTFIHERLNKIKIRNPKTYKLKNQTLFYTHPLRSSLLLFSMLCTHLNSNTLFTQTLIALACCFNFSSVSLLVFANRC